MKIWTILIFLFSVTSFAGRLPKFEGKARWQSSRKGSIYGHCSDRDEHGGEDNPSSYSFMGTKGNCRKLKKLAIIEFAEELLGTVNRQTPGILNASDEDGEYQDSRQLGELLRAVAIKKVLTRHRDLLGVPMKSFDTNKCYQFKKGMGKINNHLKEGASDNPLTNQKHPLNPIKQHQLVHAAKKIKELIKRRSFLIRERGKEIARKEIECRHYNFNRQDDKRCIFRGRQELDSYINGELKNTVDAKIENLMAANPFLSLDREKEWCVINCSDKLWESQPWIEKIANMKPQSKELVGKIKYFMAKTSSDLKKSVHSLCQVYSDEGKIRSEIQKKYQQKNSSWGAWGKWAFSFSTGVGATLREKEDLKNCLSSIMTSSSEDSAVKYIKQHMKERVESKEPRSKIIDSKEFASLVRDQCKDEKPFGWKNLMGMTSVLEEVTTKFGFRKFARCFQKQVDAYAGVKENLALGLGLACVVAAPIAPVVGFGCGALDVAAMASVNSDARINYDQMASCRSVPRVCSNANVRASISKYYSSRNDLLLSIIGEGTGVIIDGVARSTRATNATLDAAKVLDKFQEIESSFAHLPSKVRDQISKELMFYKNYGSNSDKLNGLKQIEDQINTIRENQQKAIKIAGGEKYAMRRYKCLFP